MRRVAWILWNQSEAARTDEVLQVLLTCDRVAGQKVMLETRMGVAVVQDR